MGLTYDRLGYARLGECWVRRPDNRREPYLVSINRGGLTDHVGFFATEDEAAQAAANLGED